MKRIVLATKNKGKTTEITAMLAGLGVEVFSLNDFPQIPEIVEDGDTYLENAVKKARAVAVATGMPALADDSGLEVDALQGAPGMYSARFAGAGASDEDNLQKLLADMKDLPPEKRDAAYHCVLVYYRPENGYEVFTGRWAGRIHDVPLGDGGFGYDPVFFLPERGVTAAQLTAGEKNRLSHRGQALNKFKQWLQRKELRKSGA